MLTIFLAVGLSACRRDHLNAIDQRAQWKTQVYADQGIPYVDNIVHLGWGVLIATLELKKVGRVVVVDPKGRVETIISHLNRPDGLYIDPKTSPRGFVISRILYVTLEVMKGSVIRYDMSTKQKTVLFGINNPEGIDRFANGDLIVGEDLAPGRVFRVDKNNVKHVLIENLSRPEGLCLARDGTLYIAETGRNRLVQWKNNKLLPVVTGLNEPDQVECHADGSVWITEDATPGRLLRFYKGKLYLIADFLEKPQGIAFGPGGSVFVAEQGRHRILRLTPVVAGTSKKSKR